MPLDRTIDVVVNHTLPQQTAFERVLRWLNDSKSKAADPKASEQGIIEAKKLVIDFDDHSFDLKLDAFGKLVNVHIAVTSEKVELHSEKIEGRWIEVAFIAGSVLVSESRIYSQLAEALKP